jgi:hypothetical protein
LAVTRGMHSGAPKEGFARQLQHRLKHAIVATEAALHSACQGAEKTQHIVLS